MYVYRGALSHARLHNRVTQPPRIPGSCHSGATPERSAGPKFEFSGWHPVREIYNNECVGRLAYEFQRLSRDMYESGSIKPPPSPPPTPLATLFHAPCVSHTCVSSWRSIVSRGSSRVKPLSNVARSYTHIPGLLTGELCFLYLSSSREKFRPEFRTNGEISKITSYIPGSKPELNS